MAKKTTIEEKIKNLLRLSSDQGATEDERNAAMLMAQKIMIKNDIKLEDVMNYQDMSSAMFERMNEVYIKPATDYKKLTFYERSLANIIASNFRSKVALKWRIIDGKKKRRIEFYGIRKDVEIGVEVFDFALISVVHLADDFIRKALVSEDEGLRYIAKTERKILRNDFMKGYCQGLDDKFLSQVESESFELALVISEEVEELYKKEVTGRVAKPSQVTFADNEHALAAGYEEGQNFNYGVEQLNTGGENDEVHRSSSSCYLSDDSGGNDNALIGDKIEELKKNSEEIIENQDDIVVIEGDSDKTNELKRKDVVHIILTAIEGKVSTLWMGMDTEKWIEKPEDVEISVWFSKCLLSDQEVHLHDKANTEKQWTLDLRKLIKGVNQHITETENKDILSWDEQDADRILQYALFDEIIYDSKE